MISVDGAPAAKFSITGFSFTISDSYADIIALSEIELIAV
jgi:hypothetical protein